MCVMNTMLRQAALIAVSCAAIVLAAGAVPARAGDERHTLTREAVRALDRKIYGWQLMTRWEREAYRARLDALQTPEERERFVAEHEARMQARARSRGVALPDGRGSTAGVGHGPGFGGSAAGGPGAGASGGGAAGHGGGAGSGAGGGGAGGGGGGGASGGR